MTFSLMDSNFSSTIVLYFPQFDQVVGGNLFGLLYLSLVGLDFLLKLVGQILHVLMVFAVLVGLELNASVGLSQVLRGFSVCSHVFLFQFLDELLDSAKSGSFNFVD